MGASLARRFEAIVCEFGSNRQALAEMTRKNAEDLMMALCGKRYARASNSSELTEAPPCGAPVRREYAMATRKKSTSSRKTSKSASKDVESAMRRRKSGTLKSGSGKKVTSKKQAIAIGLSEARKKGKKVARKKS